MIPSEHLLFGERQTGKTTWLIKQLVDDIDDGQDAVYVAMTEPALDHARRVLRSLIHGTWGRGQIDHHTFGWERWLENASYRRRAKVYVDDGDILLIRALARANSAMDSLAVVVFNIEWPVQALVAPPLGQPWPKLAQVSPASD